VKPFRAFGVRLGFSALSERFEREVTDLSTFTQRLTGSLHVDAVIIAPPISYYTPLAGPLPGHLIKGTLPKDPVARYLLRLPKVWNGRLVVSGAPGLNCESGYDLYWSDFLLSAGYAFACTDKGIRAVPDGDTVFVPLGSENGIAHWYPRLKALAELALEECKARYGKLPEKTYAVGVSNGGYLARLAVERDPGLFDGAVDVSGVLWRAEGSNLLEQLPAALRALDARPPKREALRALGYPADVEWDAVLQFYRFMYWEASLTLALGDLDPSYEGPLEAYDLSRRPAEVRGRIRAVECTGDLQRPLLSLSGGRDFLIPFGPHAEGYRALVEARGRAALHRLHRVADATHVDKDREAFPAAEPLMPHAHEAFRRLVRWVEEGVVPPAAEAAVPSRS
jgi:pimeloyl-ACP methyl ester carboxylesterase